MKIYTKRGDRGETSIVGSRLQKTDARVEAIGAVDELNSSLGFAIYSCKKHGLSQLTEELIVLSHQLFDAGADLAQAKEAEWKITSAHTDALERCIDAHTAKLPPLSGFILPGGSEPACALHRCRTDARKAERKINSVANVSQALLPFFNRLSDCFFTMARSANHELAEQDVLYVGEQRLQREE